jgi:hypothetical protein
MKKIYPLIILFGLSAFVFSNCSEDSGGDGPPIPEPTEMELITADTWQFVDKILNSFSIYSTLDECEQNDALLFKTSGKGEFLEGPTRCDGNDPWSTSFNWSFRGDSTEFRIDLDSFTIEELSATKFSYTKIGGPDDVTWVYELMD